MKKRKSLPKSSKKIDRTFLFLIVLLLLFGMIVIYDATVVLSQDIYGYPYAFVVQQLIWIIVGSIGFFAFSRINLVFLKKLSFIFFMVSLVFLVFLGFLGFLGKVGIIDCTNVFIFAPCINGAYRWFYLNPAPLPPLPAVGVLGFQPSELAKLSLILYLALLLEKWLKSVKAEKTPFARTLVIAGLISGLVVLQPNMSTAAILFLIAMVMYFASGASLKPMIISAPVFGIVSLLFMFSSSYRRERLMTFLALRPDTDLSSGYHIKQILIALGSGGFFGLGFGQSRQKFQYLPEVFADSIFAIIGEELGFVGTTFLVILFGLLIYKGYQISQNAPDMFSRLVAVGITTWISMQFFVNVGAMIKIIPLTGVPLPLISYGGSSLVFILMGLGVLANISKFK